MSMEMSLERTKRRAGPGPEVATERLLLRPVRMGDAEAIASSLSDLSVARMLARVPYPYALEDATDWLNIATAATNENWFYAITQPADAVLIGVVSLERQQGGWHLGYWLNRYYWNRGFMSEAVSGLMERCFRRVGNVAVHSGAFTENPASLRVQQRLGFQITGLKDTYCVGRGQMLQEVTTALTPEYFSPFQFD